MTNLLTNTLPEKISRTNNLPKKIIVNGKELNNELLEAVMSVPLVKVFGIGTVTYQEGIMFKTMDGYIYQRDKEDNEFEILVVFDNDAKKFNVFTTPDINPSYILQAVLMVDMDVNFTNIQLKDGFSIVPQVIVDENYENWNELAEYVQMLEANLNLLEDNTEINTTFFNRKKASVSDDDVEDIIEEYFSDAELEEEKEVDIEVEEVETEEEESVKATANVNKEEVEVEVEVTNDPVEAVSDEVVTKTTEKPSVVNVGNYEAMETLELYDYLRDNGIGLQEIVDETGVSMSVLSQYGNRKKMPKKSSTINKIRYGLISIANRSDFKPVQTTLVQPMAAQTKSVQQQIVTPVVQEKPQVQQKLRLPLDENKIRMENPGFFNDLTKRKYLDQFDLDEKVVDRVVKLAKYNRERLMERYGLVIVEDVPNVGKYMGDTFPIKVAISTVLSMRHLAVTGPSGCGKSTLIETICWLFNLPLYKIDGNNSVGQDSYLGQRTFDENGNITVLDGMLILAMETGGVFYFDEMNMTRGSSVSKTNGALDKQRKILNELKAQKQTADDNFRCFVSYNPDYEDTNPVNKATNDRVERLVMDYMDQEHLYTFVRRIGEDFTEYQRDILGLVELERETVNNIVQIAQLLQDKNNGLTSEVSSLRNIEAIYEHVSGGVLDLAEATRIVVDKFPEQKAQILDALVEVSALNITDEEIEHAKAS